MVFLFSIMEHQRFQTKIGDAPVAENSLSRFKDNAHTPSRVIVEYLLKEVPEFRKLSELREQVKAQLSTFKQYHEVTSNRDGIIQKAIDSLKNSARLPITRIIRQLNNFIK